MNDEKKYKSRTQIKKEVEQLQKLGERLMELPLHKLEQLNLPDGLFKALKDGKTIRSRKAKQRHKQFIGVLMRGIDPAPIKISLSQHDFNSSFESEEDKMVHLWTEKLQTGDETVMEDFLNRYPDVSRQHMRQLVRNILNANQAAKLSKALNRLAQFISQTCL